MSSETPNKSESSEESFKQPEPAFGWTSYAEQINGRFAMVALVCIVLLELLTGQGLLTWLGLL
ncbi:MAG: chlorophyll A-B binding protein [Moorea sp. SIO4A1]|uniref:chlorophyll a/b-binding protein n=1 Tax=Moorena sp. SIO4A1 TaxID=2607835 RepID=UPI0014184D76|nr:chlorophyll a/b-binding protein [Moorena sp. SIO4A1]NEO42836.1 chlorophyll A-B binding protein [Moorena sp. SIO4A3]NEQ63756.1 chlorophyll A-B binding protein [Moorena sp. SIO4A1]